MAVPSKTVRILIAGINSRIAIKKATMHKIKCFQSLFSSLSNIFTPTAEAAKTIMPFCARIGYLQSSNATTVKYLNLSSYLRVLSTRLLEIDVYLKISLAGDVPPDSEASKRMRG